MTRPKIVASLLTQDQEYQAMQAAEAAAAAERAGFDINVVYAKNNANLQAEQLYRVIHAPEPSRPVAIVVQTVAGDGLPKVAREAAKAGIGWLLLNRDADYIAALRAEYPKLPIGIVTTDQVGIGRIQGKQARARLPHGGGVLYIQGPPDTSAARERLQGFQEILQPPAISMQILDAEWTEASGERAVRSWLRLSSTQSFALDLVVAQNDAMAIGARKAIAAVKPGWSTRPFIGCDGLADGGQRLVKEGQLAATVVMQATAGPAVSSVATCVRAGSPTGLSTRLVLAPRPFPE